MLDTKSPKYLEMAKGHISLSPPRDSGSAETAAAPMEGVGEVLRLPMQEGRRGACGRRQSAGMVKEVEVVEMEAAVVELTERLGATSCGRRLPKKTAAVAGVWAARNVWAAPKIQPRTPVLLCCCVLQIN
jgi:hypothetical protein